MKRCPQCGELYSDDDLNFCLQHGKVLTSVELPPFESEFTVKGETYSSFDRDGYESNLLAVKHKYTWQEIFTRIAPFLRCYPSELAVSKHFAKSLGMSFIDNENLVTIGVQLEAYGIVKIEPHPTQDDELVWSLTDKGRRRLLASRLVVTKLSGNTESQEATTEDFSDAETLVVDENVETIESTKEVRDRLPKDVEKLLVCIAELDVYATEGLVFTTCEFSQVKGDHLINRLLRLKLINFMAVSGETIYNATEKGAAYLVENDLID